jgi:glycosyltransferase involved in cell wall biosynthesis
MARINLIAWDNPRGLGHDVRLLADTLVALGHELELTRLGPRRHDGRWRSAWLHLKMAWRWLASGGRQARLYDLNIALEHVRPPFMRLARRNALVPNPEWLSPRSQRYLPRFDAVLCKTRHAAEIFTARGCRALHIGFDSVDCHRPDVPREPTFLHLAGASQLKGTQRLLAVWQRHPEWPKLVVVQAPATDAPAPVPAANVEYRIGHIDTDEVRRLQNTHAVHLCLSETEGWGHYLVEAMSCGALVITCDAPPMHELVDASRGLLVRTGAGAPFNLAQRYCFDEAALERVIEQVLAMPPAQRLALGAQARAWFEDNHRNFAARLEAALREVL